MIEYRIERLVGAFPTAERVNELGREGWRVITAAAAALKDGVPVLFVFLARQIPDGSQ